MNPEQREHYLKELAKMTHGTALMEWLDIEIKRLENLSLVPEENFEVEARGRRAAAKTIRKLFNYLKVNKEEKKEEGKTSYE